MPNPTNPIEEPSGRRWKIVFDLFDGWTVWGDKTESVVEVISLADHEQAVRELREALEQTHHAIEETATALLAVEGTLRQPYPDSPKWSPWTRWFDRHEGTAWTLLAKADVVARSALARTGGQDG